ncbi:FkbM family methyltransferase [Coleofasciculus sp. E1-EBD-02]|uniref:FkbM family methyltransferase n=1 Tax=Coleofasciculus sp. E1-EBD-02 TaxID=3068481 RepID=UPI0032F5C6F2
MTSKLAKKYPLVSVTTVTLNAANFIKKTIKSVINQSYPSIEYIIVDGGSSDGTLDIVKEYSKFIATWQSEPDNSLFYAINKALFVSGDWIGVPACMNSQNLFALRLHSLVNYLANPRLLNLRLRGGSTTAMLYLSLNKTWLHSLQIATIFDIGAHTGQFSIAINALFPNARIYSFEPLPDCFNKLQKRMENKRNFDGFNFAIGDQSHEVELKCSSFTASSSFLKMTDVHKAAFPHTRKNVPLKVKVESLDSIVAKEKISIIEPCLIKIDVQGYEEYVLRGGENTIKQATVIIIETSFEELYQGQPLFNDIYSWLRQWGFTYKGSLSQLLNPQNGEVLQADSVFVKHS